MTVMTTSMPAAASVLGEGRGETLFRVCGAAPLRGTVDIKGAKNAALPIIAATLLSAEPCILENVPDIADIRLMMAVLRHLGARVAFDAAAGRLEVEAAEIRSRTTPEDLASRLRGSFLVMGPLLARFGQASAPQPGGCVIGSRPLDVPIRGFIDLGAQVTSVDGRFAASGRLAHLWLVPNPPHNPQGDFGLSADGLALNEAPAPAPAPPGAPGGGRRFTFSTVALYRRALFAPPWCGIIRGNPQGTAAPLAPLLRSAIASGQVSAELYTGPWTDVGTPERLAQLNAG